MSKMEPGIPEQLRIGFLPVFADLYNRTWPEETRNDLRRLLDDIAQQFQENGFTILLSDVVLTPDPVETQCVKFSGKHLDLLIVAFVAVVIGFALGLLTGIFGIGGGFLITPVLMIFLGIPGEVAVGTGLAAILPNSFFGLLKRRGTGTVDYKLAVVIAVGSVTGVMIGSRCMDRIKAIPTFTLGAGKQNPVQFILLVLFFLILAAIMVGIKLYLLTF